ncbi:uncharacterized protein At5g19025 [Beta vulgaris subsp. vulgaris]|uniref:uncharacterized protein At5g19025 n=1 Tax=Beta vulgaris subsp. vulgaris TaxID=3555 RepID=UPI0020371276|nr:uncharacterized protein At5g19025 [Beta vulgaris subsp. vulgaris]
MVYHNTVCKSIEQSNTMTVSMSLSEPDLKSKQINQIQKNRRLPNSSNHQVSSSCCESRLAVLDVIMLIAAIGAIGFLLYPYVSYTYVKVAEIGSLVCCILKDEIYENPMIYGSLGLSMVCVAMAAWAIVMCTTRKCANPSCRGLWKAAEFDIQLETEECVKNSNSPSKDGVKRGLFELPRDHHRELEAELKKIAPPNGRAVLVFRARCGCSVGRMEVPGPRKARKIKK